MTLRIVVSAMVVALAGAAADSSAAPEAKRPPPCRDAALVSLRSGKVLRRFTVVGSDFVGRYATGPSIPGASAVGDGHGGWFVAGAGIRRLRRDGTLDRRWRSDVRGKRLAGLAREGGILYTHDGYRVMALSAADGHPLWSSQRMHRGSQIGILTLAATRRAVFVGGYLTDVGGTPRHQLTALDARTGRLLAWQAPRPHLYPASRPVVATLAVASQRLYFGGSFLGLGGAERKQGVAAVRLSDGSLTGFRPLKTMWNASAIALADGGRLVLIGGPEGGGVFDSRTGAERTRASQLVSRAGAIGVRGSIAYIGGTVRTSVGGKNLLAVDLHTGKLRTWFPNLAREVSVGTIALSGDRAFVGGQFCASLG